MQMTIRIGLISDVHACVKPLQEALAVFRREGVAMVFCAGDIAGYGTELGQTVALLRNSGCLSIQGNHDVWYLDHREMGESKEAAAYLAGLPRGREFFIEGIHLSVVHASPPQSLNSGIRLLDEQGGVLPGEKKRWRDKLDTYPFDVLVVGHTHQVFAEQLGIKLIINPGSTWFNHTCAILSLPDKVVRFISLSGREPVLSWNWGLMVRN